jgi:hypothetical protein
MLLCGCLERPLYSSNIKYKRKDLARIQNDVSCKMQMMLPAWISELDVLISKPKKGWQFPYVGKPRSSAYIAALPLDQIQSWCPFFTSYNQLAVIIVPLLLTYCHSAMFAFC